MGAQKKTVSGPAGQDSHVHFLVKWLEGGADGTLKKIGGPHCLVRMVQNPTREMMRFYISEGQLAAFKVLSHITHCLAIEKQLGASLGGRRHTRLIPGALASLGKAQRRTNEVTFDLAGDLAHEAEKFNEIGLWGVGVELRIERLDINDNALGVEPRGIVPKGDVSGRLAGG